MGVATRNSPLWRIRELSRCRLGGHLSLLGRLASRSIQASIRNCVSLRSRRSPPARRVLYRIHQDSRRYQHDLSVEHDGPRRRPTASRRRLRTQKQDTRQGGEAERRPRRRHSLTSASLDADVDLADKAAGGSIECGSLEGEFTMTQRAADHGRSGPSGAPVNILRRPLERRAHGRALSQGAEAPQRCISNGAGLHHSDFTGPSSWRRP